MLFRMLGHRRFQAGNEEILFSTKTCGIFRIDPITSSIIDYLENHDPSPRETVIEALSGDHDAEEIGVALDELVRAGLASSDLPEGRHPERDRRKRGPLPRISHLVMNVAHTCNLACRYCYADGGRYGGERALMRPATALELVDFLLDNAEDDKVMITFFGGEPLLNFEVVRAATLRAEGRAEKLGKKVDFAMTTNGTLLTDDIIRFVSSHNIKLAVSIDGPKRAHDRHRKYIDGRGSYDVILANLWKLNAKGRFPARATLTRQNTDAVGVVDHLLNLGFQQVGLAPVDALNEEFALDEEKMEELFRGFEILAVRFRDQAVMGKPYGFTNIINLMKLFHHGDTKPLPCGAGIRLAASSPEGNLFICHRFSGYEDCRIGDVRKGIDEKRREELLGSLLVESKPTCRSCWAKHLCGGGCYYLAHLHNKDLGKPHALTCRFLLRWYEFGINIYCDLLRKNPSFLELCSGEDLSC